MPQTRAPPPSSGARGETQPWPGGIPRPPLPSGSPRWRVPLGTWGRAENPSGSRAASLIGGHQQSGCAGKDQSLRTRRLRLEGRRLGRFGEGWRERAGGRQPAERAAERQQGRGGCRWSLLPMPLETKVCKAGRGASEVACHQREASGILPGLTVPARGLRWAGQPGRGRAGQGAGSEDRIPGRLQEAGGQSQGLSHPCWAGSCPHGTGGQRSAAELAIQARGPAGQRHAISLLRQVSVQTFQVLLPYEEYFLASWGKIFL